MADERQYNAAGEVVSGYLSPDEARDAGVAWAPRPNEPAPYRTEDESRDEGTVYVPEAQHYANVGGNYDYYQNIDRLAAAEAARRYAAMASQVTRLGASEGSSTSPTVGPVGLAYPDDPVNYATGQMGPSQGYNGLQSGIYPAGSAPVSAAGLGTGLNTFGLSTPMMLGILGAAGVALYFLMKK